MKNFQDMSDEELAKTFVMEVLKQTVKAGDDWRVTLYAKSFELVEPHLPAGTEIKLLTVGPDGVADKRIWRITIPSGVPSPKLITAAAPTMARAACAILILQKSTASVAAAVEQAAPALAIPKYKAKKSAAAEWCEAMADGPTSVKHKAIHEMLKNAELTAIAKKGADPFGFTEATKKKAKSPSVPEGDMNSSW